MENKNLILAILVLGSLYFMKKSKVKLFQYTNSSKHNLGQAQFTVILPKSSEFINARVVLVNGSKNLIKYNSGSLSNTIRFALDSTQSHIDKIKIRTTNGNEYNYDKQKVNGTLKVEPIVHFENLQILG